MHISNWFVILKMSETPFSKRAIQIACEIDKSAQLTRNKRIRLISLARNMRTYYLKPKNYATFGFHRFLKWKQKMCVENLIIGTFLFEKKTNKMILSLRFDHTNVADLVFWWICRQCLLWCKSIIVFVKFAYFNVFTHWPLQSDFVCTHLIIHTLSSLILL